MKLNKVVIPVAGLGTRMLPATKVIPKEMLPVLDKPIIQYVVEEVLNAGFKEIILVTHSSKNSIENHFDTSFELEATLERRIKRSLLREIKNISRLRSKIFSVRQSEAKGLGHAILQAKELVNGEPFAVVLPDRVMDTAKFNPKKDNLAYMRKSFLKNQTSIMLFEKVPLKEVSKYGIAKLDKSFSSQGTISRVLDILEKPNIKKAPSRYAAVGRYIFDNQIFDHISNSSKDGKEIEITDGIKHFMSQGNKVNATLLKGECFDCGSKEGYFRSILMTGMTRSEYKKEIRKVIKDL
jgi:UTP--glucose-1-phosphate uridylyltransferase